MDVDTCALVWKNNVADSTVTVSENTKGGVSLTVTTPDTGEDNMLGVSVFAFLSKDEARELAAKLEKAAG